MFARKRIARTLAIVFFLGWILYFFLLWRDMIWFDGRELRVGAINVWGDWAMHFSQGSVFAYRTLFPKTHPLLYGAPFSYPFFVNMISGVLVRTGMDFFTAFVVPSYILSVFFVTALFVFYRRIFKSFGVAILGTLIFMLNGGLGFWWYIQSVLKNPTAETIFGFTQEYTHMPKMGIEWINIITSMVIPQRSFALGFPVAIVSMVLIYLQLEKKIGGRDWRAFLAAGVLFGFMPILHMHSFFTLCLVYLWWGLWSVIPVVRKYVLQRTAVHKKELGILLKQWSIFSAPAVAIASCLIFTFFFSTAQKTLGGGFFRWVPGWYANPHEEHHTLNWFAFWILNWGVVPVMAVIGWLRCSMFKKIMLFPFFAMFALMNLFLFQPFIWDNTKVLVWASLGFSGLAGYFLYALFKQRHVVVKVLAGALLFFTIFSGGLDVLMDLDKSRHNWGMYNRDALLMVNQILAETPPTATFLTSDVHNNAIINLTGRNVLMGYRGWLWTYGLDYSAVEKDVFTMFRAQPGFEELFEKYHVDYVAFDGQVRDQWNGNETYYKKRYPMFYGGPEYTVYKVR